MFSRTESKIIASSSNSSLDWENDEGSQSWASSASWSDEVETEATARLSQQWDDVESVLYGEASPKILPPALRQEIAQWRATFPHFRLRGTKPPYGPRPSEPEVGQEEVYACHGLYDEISDVESDHSEDFKSQESCTGEKTHSLIEHKGNIESSDRNCTPEQIAFGEKVKKDVLDKLVEKLYVDVVAQKKPRVVKESEAPPVSGCLHREPLLATRQSAQRDATRRILQTPQDPELGMLLRVSPLPRRQIPNPVPKAGTASSRRGVTLPPIDVRPESSRSSSLPLSVFGRQTRLIQQKTRSFR